MAREEQQVGRVHAEPIRVHIWFALAAVAVGLYVGGGLRRPQAVEFACASAVALVWAFFAEPPRRADLNLLTGSLACLAIVAMVRAQAAGAGVDGLGYVLVCATTISLVLVAQRTSSRERQVLVDGTIALLGLLSLVGIAGLALHSEPLALSGLGAWRVSTTLTYPNAAAAVFGPTALLALDRAGRSTRPWWYLIAAALLLTGALATLSRAAPVALLVGLGLLCRRSGLEVTARAAIPAAVGMVVFGASLAPGLAQGSRPGPLVAALGAAAASVAVVATSSLTRSISPGALVAGALGAAVAVAVVFGVAIGTRGGLAASSADRTEEAKAAFGLLRGSPLTGVGPGATALEWQNAAGERFQAKYAHNDYLQVAAELGLIGIVSLGVVVGSGAVLVSKGGRGPAVTADLAPALLCFALHVGQDFVAHFPAVVGVAALWVGVAWSQARSSAGSFRGDQDLGPDREPSPVA